MATVLKELHRQGGGPSVCVRGVAGPMFSNEPIELTEVRPEMRPCAIELHYRCPSPNTRDVFYLSTELENSSVIVQGPYRTPQNSEGYMRIPINFPSNPISVQFIPSEDNSEGSKDLQTLGLNIMILENDNISSSLTRTSLFQSNLIYIANELFVTRGFYTKYKGLEAITNEHEDPSSISRYVESFLETFEPDVKFKLNGSEVLAHSFIIWPNGIVPQKGNISEILFDEETQKYEVIVKDIKLESLKWLLWFAYAHESSVIAKVLFGFDVEKLMQTTSWKGEFLKEIKTHTALENKTGPVPVVFGSMLGIYMLACELNFVSLRTLCEDVFISKILKLNPTDPDTVTLISTLLSWSSFFSPQLSNKLIVASALLKEDITLKTDKNKKILVLTSNEKTLDPCKINILENEEKKAGLFWPTGSKCDNDSDSTNQKGSKSPEGDNLNEYEQNLREHMNMKQEQFYDQLQIIFSPNVNSLYCKKTGEYIHIASIDTIENFNKIIEVLESISPEDEVQAEILDKARRNCNSGDCKGCDKKTEKISKGKIVKLREEIKKANIIGDKADELVFPCKVLTTKIVINELGFPQSYAEVTSRIQKWKGEKKYDASYLSNTPPPEMPFGMVCTIPTADLVVM